MPGPVASFTRLRLGVAQGASQGDIIALRGVFSGNSDKDVPLHQVQVRYARYGLVLTADAVAAAVPAETAAKLSQEYRTTDPAENAAALAKYRGSGTLTHDTLLVNQEDAEAIRSALLDLLSQHRLTLEIEVKLGEEMASVLAVAAIVEVKIPRYGFNNGRTGQIMSYTLNSKTNTATLQVWMAAHG